MNKLLTEEEMLAEAKIGEAFASLDFAPLVQRRAEIAMLAMDELRDRLSRLDNDQLITALAILLSEEGEIS